MKTEIGKIIKRLRTAKGLTQKELAFKAGVDYTYIGKIERGEQLPSLKVLTKIGRVFSLPLSYFFQERETRAVTEISSYGLGFLTKNEKWLELLNTFKLLHENDIPLVVEIIKVLQRHRKASKKGSYETSEDIYLKAAEEEGDYGKK